MSGINYGTFANPTVTHSLVLEEGEQLAKISFEKVVARKGLPSLDVTISYFFKVTNRNEFVRLERVIPLPGYVGRFYPEHACEAMIDRSLELDLMEQCPSRLAPYLERVKDALYGLGRRIYRSNKAQRPPKPAPIPLASGKTRGRPRKNQDAETKAVEAPTTTTKGA